jgi:hypothetical protein
MRRMKAQILRVAVLVLGSVVMEGLLMGVACGGTEWNASLVNSHCAGIRTSR